MRVVWRGANRGTHFKEIRATLPLEPPPPRSIGHLRSLSALFLPRTSQNIDSRFGVAITISTAVSTEKQAVLLSRLEYSAPTQP